MHLQRLALLFCAVFFAIQYASAQCIFGGSGQGNLSLYGRVVSTKDNLEVSGAVVRLEGRNERRQTVTDNRGFFNFLCLEADSYVLEISRRGFLSARVQAPLLSNTIPDFVVRLEPEPRERASPKVPGSHTVSLREAQIPQAARSAFGKGRKELYEKKRPKRSLKHFEKALALYPDFDEAYVQLAIAYSRLSRLEDAEQILRKAIRVYPQNARAYAILGKVYNKQESVEEAMAALREAIKIDNQLWLAHLDLGRILGRQGQVEEAYHHASLAHQIAADVQDTHLVFYNACINSRKYAAALAEIDEFVSLYPNSDIAKRMLAVRENLSREVSEKVP